MCCTRRCTGPAWRARRSASTPPTACTLNGTRVVAAVRCAPPANAPTPAERSTCAPWLTAEWRLIGGEVRVIVALGAFGWRSALDMIRAGGGQVPRPQPKFGHGATATVQRRPRRGGAAGLLPPQPAEHLHRQAHLRDARRHLRSRRGRWRVSVTSGNVRPTEALTTSCGFPCLISYQSAPTRPPPTRWRPPCAWRRPPTGWASPATGSPSTTTCRR